MKPHIKGFTLVELMITVAIVGILAAIAYPSYTQYVLRSHRTVARAELLQDTQTLEKFFTTNGTYVGALTLPYTTSDGYYTVAAGGAGVNAQSYQLTATAAGAQAADTHCAVFSIDNINSKTGTTNADCWNK